MMGVMLGSVIALEPASRTAVITMTMVCVWPVARATSSLTPPPLIASVISFIWSLNVQVRRVFMSHICVFKNKNRMVLCLALMYIIL